jgi:arylsulfatase
MSNDTIPKNSATSTEPTSAGMKRRDLLLSGSSLLAASVAITD